MLQLVHLVLQNVILQLQLRYPLLMLEAVLINSIRVQPGIPHQNGDDRCNKHPQHDHRRPVNAAPGNDRVFPNQLLALVVTTQVQLHRRHHRFQPDALGEVNLPLITCPGDPGLGTIAVAYHADAVRGAFVVVPGVDAWFTVGALLPMLLLLPLDGIILLGVTCSRPLLLDHFNAAGLLLDTNYLFYFFLLFLVCFVCFFFFFFGCTFRLRNVLFLFLVLHPTRAILLLGVHGLDRIGRSPGRTV
uniref:(northern house mosquito) hypothetical protein n=1 Tax=Culex pipiens TaxID=7175 RepID=A0A8D8BM31_CULPI